MRYTPPDGGLYVSDPRTITDILLRSLAIHVFSICAYTQLRALQSWKTSRELRILYTAAFTLFPEVILVNLFYNFVNAFRDRLRSPSEDTSASYLISRLLGVQVITEESPNSSQLISGIDSQGLREESVLQDSTWTCHLLFAILNIIPLGANVLAYIERFRIGYRAASDVGNLGFDHRTAWIAIGGTMSATLSILILLRQRKWYRNAVSTRPQRVRSDIGTARKTIFDHISIAGVIHTFLLAKTHHAEGNLRYLTIITLVMFFICRLLVCSARSRRSWLDFAVTFITIVLVMNNAVMQLTVDINELYNIANGQVEAYNYRWKVKDILSTKTKFHKNIAYEHV